jgi:hypothetical protein
VLLIDRAVSGERHADVASDLHNLAWFLHKHRGRSAEGEALSRRAVAMRRDLLGARHPQTLSSMRQLGDILSGRGHFTATPPPSRPRTDLAAALARARTPAATRAAGH